MLESGQILGFDRRGDSWHEWTGKRVERLAELLDYNRGPGGEDLREGSMLCAPLVTRDGVFGVMKVRGTQSREPDALRCRTD